MCRLIVCFFLLCIQALAWASEGSWWFTVATGRGFGENISGWGNHAAVSYQPSGSRLWTLRGASVLDKSSLLAGFPLCSLAAVTASTSGTCAKNAYVSDVALVYSWLHRADFYYFSAGAGPAWVRYKKAGKNSKKHRALGLGYELQAFRLLTPYAAVGGLVYGDANPKRSFNAAALAVQIGMMD